MTEFLYSALDAEHHRHSGTLTAPDRNTAMRILAQTYPVVTGLESHRPGLLHRVGIRRTVSSEELVTFTQTLATMLDAGLTLKNALDLLARELRSPALNDVIVQISSDLGQGRSMSQAMAQHPHVFDKLYRSLVLAGETGGQLPLVLNRLGDFLERTHSVKSKLRSAMLYPTLVLAFAFLVGTLIISIGVPQLESLYSALGSKLPAATLALLTFSRFMASNLLVVLGIGLGAFLLIGWWLRSESGGFVVDRFKLEFGLTKELFQSLYTARFAESLGTLYSAGVPLLKTLDIIGDTMGNRILSGRLKRVTTEVQDGVSLAQALHHHEIVAELAVGLVEAGEQSGQLEPILRRVSRFYEEKFSHGLQALASLAEPALMIFVGLMVATIILLLGLPFMNLVTVLS